MLLLQKAALTRARQDLIKESLFYVPVVKKLRIRHKMRRYATSLLISVVCLIGFGDATVRYYGSYIAYATGDTILFPFNNHGGPVDAHRKWIVECQDGEAMIGIQDQAEDFTRITSVWCKFMFPLKPPTIGLYPYYPSCHVRNYTAEFHCFDSFQPNKTINTFMTGLYDYEFIWYVNNNGANGDRDQPYKCCRTPHGYYIDYVSCYYMPTHDVYFEYYDALNQFFVTCSTGYVMTGISKKVNPFKSPQWYIEWIQCCRVGYGARTISLPPVVTSSSGRPSYVSQRSSVYPKVPPSYAHQYQAPVDHRCRNNSQSREDCSSRFGTMLNLRYADKPVTQNARNKQMVDHSYENVQNPVEANLRTFATM